MYVTPGIAEMPIGVVLADITDKIMTAAGRSTLTLRIGEALGGKDAAISNNQFISSVVEEQLYPLGGTGPFAPGSTAHTALLTFTMMALRRMGVLEREPVRLEYNPTPFLNFDRVVDRTMGSYYDQYWPTLEDFKGANAKWEVFKTVIPRCIRQMDYVRQQRPRVVAMLRTKLADIGWKLAHGMAVDQAEKSFFLAFADQSRLTSQTAEEIAGGITPPQIAISLNESDEVKLVWEKCVSSCEAGPWTRFARFKSNRLRDGMVFYLGPQVANLEYKHGYLLDFGPFKSLRVQTVETTPWSLDGQMESARDRFVSMSTSNPGTLNVLGPITPFAFSWPVAIAVPGAPVYTPNFDVGVEGVHIHMATRGGSVQYCNNFEVTFFSSERQREVSTANGYGADTMLYEAALQVDELGEGATTGKTLDSWPLIDLDNSPSLTGFYSGQSFVETIYLPDGATRKVVAHQVNMGDFYSRMGNMQVRPAFTEFVLAPNSWLSVPDQAAEHFIMSRLNLRREAIIRGQDAVRLSHNMAKLTRLFGQTGKPAMDVQQVIKAKAGF